MVSKKNIKKEMLERGMTMEQLEKKFGTVGDIKKFYKKWKIPKKY